MRLRFYINPATGEPHFHDHGVAAWEVEDIMETFYEDVAAHSGARAAIGQTRNGRWLRVIYRQTPDPDELLIVTAFTPTTKALRAIRRRLRK